MNIVKGRPDFRDRNFGCTELKRFPPYVYSLLGGALVHKVARVEANWYKVRMNSLERLDSPKLTIFTVCGAMFYVGVVRLTTGAVEKRAMTCALPKPDAVLCGRCHGEEATFSRRKGNTWGARRKAKRRIGCVIEGQAKEERA